VLIRDATQQDGRIVGTAETHRNQGGPGAHVANAGFMVAAGHEGKGIGRALAQHAIDQARADGYRAMQFNAVAESNVRAIALWRSLGFEVLATVPEGFHHPSQGYVGLLDGNVARTGAVGLGGAVGVGLA
jgi:ribosomal protein S18 acetylase RimI-like enzyme